jgi:hypothetical protein
MSSRRRQKAAKKASPRAARKANPAKAAAPPPDPGPDAVPAEDLGREPSPEELLALEASVQLDQARAKALGLARQYPRADRPLVNPLTDVLQRVPGLSPVQARVVAQSLKRIGDNAHDLSEILDRILNEKHEPGEVAELVMGFQLVTEQLATYTDALGEKLYQVFDRAKGLK